MAGFGGATGLRDEGLLDSALARPLNTYAYNPECTLADLAAANTFGLAKKHAFVDGNKRAAFLAIGIFLSSNGYAFVADQADSIRTILALATGEIEVGELAAWTRKNSIRK